MDTLAIYVRPQKIHSFEGSVVKIMMKGEAEITVTISVIEAL